MVTTPSARSLFANWNVPHQYDIVLGELKLWLLRYALSIYHAPRQPRNVIIGTSPAAFAEACSHKRINSVSMLGACRVAFSCPSLSRSFLGC